MSDHKPIIQEDRGYLYSEEWRGICEARYLLDGMDLFERRAYLADVKRMRGIKGEEELKQALLVEVKERKNGQSNSRD